MVFQANGLRDAFEGQGEAGFMGSCRFPGTYATYDTLEAVLRPGYFNSVSRLPLSWCLSAGRPA